jgi:exopolyphosphatase/guanosine-5'-triphosphate,3'-diphosphate pyrophosphatase
MGTNTFNLLIVEVALDDKYNILYNHKLPVKLGKGGIHNNLLLQDAVERATEALQKHHQSILKHQVDRTFVYATSAIRGATNGTEITRVARDLLQTNIHTISGDEEAKLIYLGVKQAVPLKTGNVLILDIGGGSNEFIIANNQGIKWKKSYDLGIARLLEIFQPDDPIHPKQIEEITRYFENEMADIFPLLKTYQPKKLIGAAGSFETFLQMIEGTLPDANEIPYLTSKVIDYNQYLKLHEKLVKSTFAEREKMKGLEPMRVEMIVLASVFVNFILQKSGIKEIIYSDFSLKEGVIYNYLNTK